MKLHLTVAHGQNMITGYGDGYVLVNARRHMASLVVMPEFMQPDWPVRSIAELTESHLDALMTVHAPELILLGTGRRHGMPALHLLPRIQQAGIGLEIMDTQAACRTYNYLAAEGRKVAAALIIET